MLFIIIWKCWNTRFSQKNTWIYCHFESVTKISKWIYNLQRESHFFWAPPEYFLTTKQLEVIGTWKVNVVGVPVERALSQFVVVASTWGKPQTLKYLLRNHKLIFFRWDIGVAHLQMIATKILEIGKIW